MLEAIEYSGSAKKLSFKSFASKLAGTDSCKKSPGWKLIHKNFSSVPVAFIAAAIIDESMPEDNWSKLFPSSDLDKLVMLDVRDSVNLLTVRASSLFSQKELISTNHSCLLLEIGLRT